MRAGTAALSAFVSACCGGRSNVPSGARSAAAMLMTTGNGLDRYNARPSMHGACGRHHAISGRGLSSASKKRSRHNGFFAVEKGRVQVRVSSFIQLLVDCCAIIPCCCLFCAFKNVANKCHVNMILYCQHSLLCLGCCMVL